MDFFVFLFGRESCLTLLLYIAITIMVFIAGSKSQRYVTAETGNRIEIALDNRWFIISFGIMWLFTFFNNVGNDIENYVGMFDYFSPWTLFHDLNIEPGYQLLCMVIDNIVINNYIALGIVKTIILVLLFWVLYRLNDKIHIGFALLAYMTLEYFESFNLIRISLAAVIILCAIVMEVEEKTKYAFILFCIVPLIHYTAIIGILVYLVIYFTKRIDQKYEAKIMFLVTGIFSLLFIVVLPWGITNFSLLEKYRSYLNLEEFAIGPMQFVFYIPVFITILGLWKIQRNNIEHLSIWMVVFGFVISMFGYKIGMISRMNIFFDYNYIILIPMFVHQLRVKQFHLKEVDLHISPKYKCNYKKTYMLVLFYFIGRFILAISGYMSASGIYPYELWL